MPLLKATLMLTGSTPNQYDRPTLGKGARKYNINMNINYYILNKFSNTSNSTINILKSQTLLLFLFSIKIVVITAGIHKMFVRQSNREDADKTIRRVFENYFSYFSTKTYVVGTQMNHLNETVNMFKLMG